MSEFTLNATARKEKGKGFMRRLRKKGYIPGVLYGKKQAAVPLTCKHQDLLKFFETGNIYNRPLNLLLEDGNDTKMFTAFIKEVQQDPITGFPLHIDIYSVAPDQKVVLPIPLKPVGRPVGLDNKGILQQSGNEIVAEGFVHDFPRYIEVSLTPLDVGDTLTVSDLQIPEALRVIDSGEKVLFHVLSAKKVAV